MKTLISKLQYKNYERGEFNGIEPRTAEETIQLIKDYPWEEQRQLASVELTCPSVTIEHYSGQFLKLGPHFGGKFCLYLSNGRKISEKIIQHLEDSFEIITDFYNDVNISKGFDRLFMIFRPKRHFVTASFQYTCTTARLGNLFFIPAFFVFTGIFLAALSFIRIAGPFPIWPAMMLALLFVAVASKSLRFLTNYYPHTKDLYLNLSRGHDNFYFGTEDDYREYFKTDIISINIYENHNQKRGSQYAVFEINFKNGEQIRFPNLLLSATLFYKKFSGQSITKIHQRYPLL